MKRLFSRPIALLNSANVVVLVSGLAVAFHRASPHAVQRTGAVVAAVTGLFVIWQVLDEIRMEGLLEHEAHAEEAGEPLPIDRTVRNLLAAGERRKASALRQARLMMVVLIATWLSVGEALHGFGDLIFAFFGPAPAHGADHGGDHGGVGAKARDPRLPSSAAPPHTAP